MSAAPIRQVATISLVATIAVVAVKLWAAWHSGAVSVLGEGLQSTVDIAMSALALFAVRVSSRPPDATHPYGHGKAEVLAGAFQMLMVVGTGIYIVVEAVRRFQNPQPVGWTIGALGMGVAVLSNVAVVLLIRSTLRRHTSPALESEAMHLRGDLLSSLGVLAGMLLVGVTGALWLDPAVAIIATVLGSILAVRHLGALSHSLMEGALSPEEIQAIERLLIEHPETRGFHDVRTRTVGALRVVDLHVLLDDGLSFVEAHDIAERLETEISRAMGGARVTIHYEPDQTERAHRAEAHGESPQDEKRL